MDYKVSRIGETAEGEVEDSEKIDLPPAIGEVDLNKVEPWDLPWKAKIGEKECRVFHKPADGTKAHMSAGLPPLMDSSPYLKSRGRDSFAGTTLGGLFSNMTCLFDQTTDDKSLVAEFKDDFKTTMFGSASTNLIPNIGSLLDYGPLFLQENSSILKMLLDSEETQFKKNLQNSGSSESEVASSSLHGHDPSASTGPVNLDCVWNF
ncbi:unnamed protein product [Arabidopsis arenosa]|uniref:Uncharacterized protein n=1 Tax=Arabidopsis arenosa TaxID=38785 RepID=A0A8S1ZY58_ARAAE|nr:unnamed protein product [Arabidopsis arenosa]